MTLNCIVKEKVYPQSLSLYFNAIQCNFVELRKLQFFRSFHLNEKKNKIVMKTFTKQINSHYVHEKNSQTYVAIGCINNEMLHLFFFLLVDNCTCDYYVHFKVGFGRKIGDFFFFLIPRIANNNFNVIEKLIDNVPRRY